MHGSHVQGPRDETGAAGVPAAREGGGARADGEDVPADLETAGVAELTALMAAGRTTSVALTRAYLARVAAVDVAAPALNAVRCLNPDALAEAAAADARRARGESGPLLGIPVLVKDNIEAVGMPTTAGSPALAGHRPVRDAPLVARLRAAGAVVLGKANLTEFANFMALDMPSGYSSLAGQVLNPYDSSRTPSGSSSGSGVAAAAGLATVTVGTETSGSILSPAEANSVVGIKPTLGLISRTGIVPIASSQDTAGPMTRTVADAAALLTVLTGADPQDPATAGNPLEGHDFTADLSPTALRGARIGVVAGQAPEQGGDERALWNAALSALAELGATLVDVELAMPDGYDVGATVLSHEFKRDLNAYLARLPEDAPVRSLAELIAYNEEHGARTLKFGQGRLTAAQERDLDPDGADSAEYREARARDLAGSKDQLDAAMAAYGVGALLFEGAGSSAIGAKAGYPSIVVPAGYLATSRRPFGIAFLGPAWSEPALIGYAYAYEQAVRLRRPPSEVNPALFDVRRL